MRQWVKLYTEALHDRKLRKISRIDKSVFFDLILLAGQEDNGGYLPCIDDIALELYMKVTDAKKSVTNLVNAGLLSYDDNGDLCVTKFVTRQETNLTPAEKQARYRTRKQLGNNEVTCVTETLPECNENVTLEKNRKEKNRKDIDTEQNREEEKEKNKKEKVGVADATSAHAQKSRGELKPYGIAKNVMLSDEEYRKLQEKLGVKGCDDTIEELSLYMAKSVKNAKKYTNHYYTVLSFSRNSLERDVPKQDRWDRAAEEVEARFASMGEEPLFGLLGNSDEDNKDVIDL